MVGVLTITMHGLMQLWFKSGAVIVSTPQDVALTDVRRGIAMFRKVSVPVGLLPSLRIVAPNDDFGISSRSLAFSSISRTFSAQLAPHHITCLVLRMLSVASLPILG
jgi:hypothetical protein